MWIVASVNNTGGVLLRLEGAGEGAVPVGGPLEDRRVPRAADRQADIRPDMESGEERSGEIDR